MSELDLRGWFKNPGKQTTPHRWQNGDPVDVIHRDGQVHLGCKIGDGAATDFKFMKSFPSADILFFRNSTSEQSILRMHVGKEMIKALENKAEEATVDDAEVMYTELHVDSRTFHGLIEAISRDKPNTWSFNAGGKARPYRALTLGNIKFIELTEVE